MQLLHSGIGFRAIVRAQHIANFQMSGDGSAINSEKNAPLDIGVRDMSYAIEVFQPGIRLREWFEVGKKAAAERRARRSTYFRIIDELEGTSDRNLADIGISRLSIKEIAYEAAYGDQR